MKSDELSTIEPFEISSIRPPTENNSLTFRLTRNCYWNKCGFCPVYKFNSRFSRRKIEDIKNDIKKAGKLNDVMDKFNIAINNDIENCLFDTQYQRALNLIHQIKASGNTLPAIRTANEELSADKIDKRNPINEDPELSWFLQWFKDTSSLEDSILHLLNWRVSGSKTCFLGDADSLILEPEFMAEVISDIKSTFSSISRFTVYGRTATAAKIRTLHDLILFKKAGLDRVHFGVESGSDNVLNYMKKGVSKADHIEGCLKTKEAGLSCSVYIMPGLGGKKWSKEHAFETADVISQTSPDFVRLRSLQIFPRTPAAEACQKKDFIEADESEVVREIRVLISRIDANTTIMSDSASNLLNVNGRLPEDRAAMLQIIDNYLEMDSTMKQIFSLESRLHAFRGQYGGFTEEIIRMISPYIVKGVVDLSTVPEKEAENLIKLLRSRLMP